MRQLKITKQITNRESSKAFNSYLSDVTREEMPLTGEEEAELAQKIKEGDQQALNRLVKANLRFVISVAKQYQGTGLAIDDIIQFGNIGLITAAQRFDETKGFKFISYAVWWIRQSIMAGVADSSKTVRMPLNKVSLLNKTKRAMAYLEQKLERTPTNEELYEELANIEIDEQFRKAMEKGEVVEETDEDSETDENAEAKLAELREKKVAAAYKKNKNTRSVETVLEMNLKPGSIDAPVSDDSNESFSDIMISPLGNFAVDTLNKEDFETKLRMIFKHLKPREAFVLTHNFGLFDKPVMTLDEMGDHLELTRERVRQIREKALRRMRSPSKAKFIKEFA